jgi:hypothetical protein
MLFIYENGEKEKVKFTLTGDSLKKFYSFLDKDTYAMIEASTNTFKFVELIKERVKAIYVANTHKLKMISMANTFLF